MESKDVILVDTADNPVGKLEKMQAHRTADLHRAFSVFIFTGKGDWLLQQRADHKYHSGGLWTNTCCSHPEPGQETMEAALNRLQEEMGIQCKLLPLYSFIYKAPLDHGLTEHEYDHVFAGISDSLPVINPDEVKNWRHITFEKLDHEIMHQPESFTAWFRIAYKRVQKEFIQNFAKWEQQLSSP
jgi:isopentenyl-diphosphate delta-isomerase